MTSTTLNPNADNAGFMLPVLAIAAMATIAAGSAVMLFPGSAAWLGITHGYAFITGLVLMAGALLGAVYTNIWFVLGGYVYPIGLAGVILAGETKFQGSAMFALSYTLLVVVLALVAGVLRLDSSRRA